MNLRDVYYSLSPSLRFFARKIYFFPIDFIEGITGRRGKYTPRKGDIFIGSGDFLSQGEHQVDLLKRYATLQPSDFVLDIGSGIGRTAIPLTRFLSEKGRYEGFDVVEKGINWCNKKIKPDFPNFNFMYVPLNNDLYNTSENRASEFIFPYSDREFDKAFLFSVFTHMMVGEIDHYLSEIARVLKPGGKCLSTFFVYNNHTEEMIANQKKFFFPVKKQGYRLMHEQVKSANIALAENTLKSMVAEKPLRIKKIIEGYWKESINENSENSFQDIVVFEKTH